MTPYLAFSSIISQKAILITFSGTHAQRKFLILCIFSCWYYTLLISNYVRSTSTSASAACSFHSSSEGRWSCLPGHQIISISITMSFFFPFFCFLLQEYNIRKWNTDVISWISWSNSKLARLAAFLKSCLPFLQVFSDKVIIRIYNWPVYDDVNATRIENDIPHLEPN